MIPSEISEYNLTSEPTPVIHPKIQVELIDKQIDFYTNHLLHLNKNADILNFDFVREERLSLTNLIGNLENERDKLLIHIKTL